jgi:hypothetical protein
MYIVFDLSAFDHSGELHEPLRPRRGRKPKSEADKFDLDAWLSSNREGMYVRRAEGPGTLKSVVPMSCRICLKDFKAHRDSTAYWIIRCNLSVCFATRQLYTRCPSMGP